MNNETPRTVVRKPTVIKTPRAKPPKVRKHPFWRGGFQCAAASARGSYHPDNEDSYLAPEKPPATLCVADGVGGAAHGKAASQALVKHVQTLSLATFKTPETLTDWLHQADDVVGRELARLSDRPGASTYVAAVPAWGGRRWRLSWAGDCRAYKINSKAQLECITRDDTYGNLGEPPPAGGNPDDPARMVGNGAVDKANHVQVSLPARAGLLLCSDGVHRFVKPDELEALLHTSRSLHEASRRIVQAAHRNGGHDDATVVLLKRHPWFGLSAGVWAFVFGSSLVMASLLYLNWGSYTVWANALWAALTASNQPI